MEQMESQAESSSQWVYPPRRTDMIFYVLFVAGHGYYCGTGREGPVYCNEAGGAQLYSHDWLAWCAAEALQDRMLEDGNEPLSVKIEAEVRAAPSGL